MRARASNVAASRTSRWFPLALALLAGLSPAALAWPQGMASVTSPAPPGSHGLAAAKSTVARRAAAAGRAADRLAAAQARLSRLEARAETFVERYDGAVVMLEKATKTYRDAQERFSGALRQETARGAAVARLAIEAYQTDGMLGPMTAMIGGRGGPQGYFERAGIMSVLAEHDSDILSAASASRMVAGVFRGQARDALQARQSAARIAVALKKSAQAAVAGQRRVLSRAQATRNRLAGQLAAARAREGALEQAAAAAAAAARAAASAGRGSAPSWAFSGGAGGGASLAAGNMAANWALQQLGKPYVWAAAGPGAFDCSGLAMRAWEQAGVQLDHWTGTQWTSGPHVPIGDLQRGDLVFFATDTADPNTIHHVGIYIGHQMMVDAPYTGVNVRIDTIYEPGLIGATRPA